VSPAEAFPQADKIVKALPANAIWSITITEDTNPLLPAAFNIFARSDAEMADFRKRLGLTFPDYTEDGVEQYDNYLPFITVSLILQESDNV
jgi:hypothetical protein